MCHLWGIKKVKKKPLHTPYCYQAMVYSGFKYGRDWTSQEVVPHTEEPQGAQGEG